MRILEMADGTKYTATMCGESNNVLWLSCSEIQTFADALAVFGDVAKTARMVCTIVEWPDDEPQVFEGYTSLQMIQYINNAITVALRKE